MQHPKVLAEEITNGERIGNNERWDSMKVKIGKLEDEKMQKSNNGGREKRKGGRKIKDCREDWGLAGRIQSNVLVCCA